MANPKATTSPSWNGWEISDGKKLRPVRYAASPGGRWWIAVGPSRDWIGL